MPGSGVAPRSGKRTSMAIWQSVPHRADARKKPKRWLKVSFGKRLTSYRIDFEENGERIREVIKGDFGDDWKAAELVGDRLIYRLKYGERPPEKNLIRSETLCDEIVRLKSTKAQGTYSHAETFFRVHLKPWLNDHCPYAVDFNATTWLRYKTDFRLKSPKGQLFNHWKYFVEFAKYAFSQGIIPAKVKLEFNEEKEDFRARGQLIPDDHFRAFLSKANDAWSARAIVGRLTGQRPGLIRNLRKDQVDLRTGVVEVRKQDSKNRRSYSFIMPEPALKVLRARANKYPDSPYFFPSEKDHQKPADKHMNGWHAAWARAGIRMGYTPHDCRHSRLTELFRSKDVNPALICYQHDLSIKEAMKTYIHFTAEDTRLIADNAAARAVSLIGEVA